MVARRSWTMKLAVLAVALLVAVGSWEVYKGYKKGYKGGEALAQVNITFPHFKCYNFVPAGPPVKEDVTLMDEFGTELVAVQNRHYVCAPVTKISSHGTFPFDPLTTPRLVCYHIRPSLSALKLSRTLTDQFRTESGEVTTPHLLCAPENTITIPPE